MKTLILPCLALMLGFSSLGLKAAIIETQQERETVKQAYPMQLSQDLNAGAFQFVRTIPLANDNVYAAGIYKSPLCNGWLAIAKITRNAEGANLLPAVFNKYDPKIRFAVAGDYYEGFPEFRFAWYRFVGKTYTQLGLQPPDDATAWAIAETGTCHLG